MKWEVDTFKGQSFENGLFCIFQFIGNILFFNIYLFWLVAPRGIFCCMEPMEQLSSCGMQVL